MSDSPSTREEIEAAIGPLMAEQKNGAPIHRVHFSPRQHAAKHARSLVVMITAGAAVEEVLEMAALYRVRPIHLDQLALPPEEIVARDRLKAALRAARSSRHAYQEEAQPAGRDTEEHSQPEGESGDAGT